MVLLKISTLALFITTLFLDECLSRPGHHVHHRIHVPTKIKTVFHTKIIKIPEHHHYIHEKEKPKVVKVPEHHHYFHEEENEHALDPHDYHPKDEEVEEEYESDHKSGWNGYENHHIYKKHAPPRYRKKRKHY